VTARIKVHGRGRLRRNAARAAVRIELALSEAVEDAVQAIADDARDAVPVDTGLLQSDIEDDVDAGGRSGTVGVYGEATEYAEHVEHGTRYHGDAQPFMLPAAERERGRLPGRVRKNVRKAL
jgi:HK97 gp10 family phage protein